MHPKCCQSAGLANEEFFRIVKYSVKSWGSKSTETIAFEN
jgi:hypothetical protein